MGFMKNLKAMAKAKEIANCLDCNWICDECGAYLNEQSGFTCKNGYWECEECGAINDVSEDNILDEDDIDEDFPEDEEDEIPEGCRACGGNYPLCTSGCPMFDD